MIDFLINIFLFITSRKNNFVDIRVYPIFLITYHLITIVNRQI